MSTLSKAYVTKLSSGTVLALLAFSSILFLVPFAAGVQAAQNASNPSLTPNLTVFAGTTATPLTMVVTNPISNAYAINSITFSAPSGWTFAGAPTCNGTPGAALGHLAASSSTAVTCDNGGSGASLLPGYSTAALVLGTLAGPGSVAASPAVTATMTTSVVDAGSNAAYTSTSQSVSDIATPTAMTNANIAASPTNTNFVAGTSPYTITVTIPSGQQGVPINWSVTGTTAGTSLSPTSGTTDSHGTASTTFTPSNVAGSVSNVVATIPDSGSDHATLLAIKTIAAAPSSMGFALATHTASGPWYLTAEFAFSPPTPPWYMNTGTGTLKATYTDAFGNAVNGALVSAQACTLTAFNGNFNNAGTLVSSYSPTGGNCAATGLTSNLDFLQSSVYGTIGYVSGQVTGTYTPTGGSPAPFTATNSSNHMISSTFDTAKHAVSTTPAAGSIGAGSSITMTIVVGHIQQGVPVTFIGTNNTNPYLGSFANGMGTSIHRTVGSIVDFANVTVVTDSTGTATATFNIDNTVVGIAGKGVAFTATYARPVDTAPSAFVGAGAPTGFFVTIAGTPVSLLMDVSFTNPASMTNTNQATVVNASALYVDVGIVDAYGNLAANPGPGQIQITLVSSAGSVLSATNVYIGATVKDTHGSFGNIVWTVYGAIGGTATLSGSGVVSGVLKNTGTYSVSIVSPLPTLTISSVITTKLSGGVYYTNQAGIAFKGTAAISTGYAPAAAVFSSASNAALFYKVDSGSWTKFTTGLANPSWTLNVPILFGTQGLHIVSIFVNDTLKNTAATQTFSVLYDATAPTITAVTATGSILNAGSPVQFSIVDSQGDLNATTVKATTNSSSTLTATVTGTNNPGSSVTYTVSVAGLGAGHWYVTLNAKDLAGNAATAVKTIVHVNVPQGSTFTSTGAAQATSGGFTGASVTFTNNAAGSETVNVYFVWYNSQNQVVNIGAQLNVSFASGASASFFSAYTTAGTYTVQVFVRDASNNALSSSYSATVTVP